MSLRTAAPIFGSVLACSLRDETLARRLSRPLPRTERGTNSALVRGDLIARDGTRRDRDQAE